MDGFGISGVMVVVVHVYCNKQQRQQGGCSAVQIQAHQKFGNTFIIGLLNSFSNKIFFHSIRFYSVFEQTKKTSRFLFDRKSNH